MKITKSILCIALACLLTFCLVGCVEQEVQSIFLSKSEVILGVGESIKLTATISPKNIQATLTWSSSDNEVAEVSNDGEITAKTEGSAVIKVEAPNGILAFCNVTVKIKLGRVTGNVTYKYNDFVGNRSDTGTKVYLISKSITSLPNNIALGINVPADLEDCYYTEVDGTGSYLFENIPVGEYYIILMSKNTNSGSTSGVNHWGKEIYSMFSAEGQEYADAICYLHKIKSDSITVIDDKTTTYSHDFGITFYAK